ncbi:hypothetical protein [Alsobacter sp. SYSU BS001988]
MRTTLFLAAALLLPCAATAFAQGQMGGSSTGQPATGWSGGTAPGSSPAQSGGHLNMGAGQGQGSAGAQDQPKPGASGSAGDVPAAAQGGAGGSTSLHGQVNSESGAQPK